MLLDPSSKYLPHPPVPFPPGYIRRWPDRLASSAPSWLSTDLRDGNQALVNPMSNETKLKLFRTLVKIGFKEIEIAYPAASEQEFKFARMIIESGEVPDDVTLQIITPARLDLIERSVRCLSGCKKAIIHLYNAVSPLFREVVFRKSREETINLTRAAVRMVKKITEEETARSGTQFTLNYCLETFSQTEPDFAVELGNRVLGEWGKATPQDKVIFNLAATVECAPSNQYADMVEYFSSNINQRDCVILSIHPHNDRGTAVAAAELGLLAGGQRVEGCLLGNGERTGNVDLITMALNLYSQGISPHLDFSTLSDIVAIVCECNETTVPTRYPYAGQLVFSAFAGTHQDAIKKGLDAQAKRWEEVDLSGQGTKFWSVPYIPLDPKDLGFGYENLIRVSSQSGKAGTAYVIRQAMLLDLPRRMQGSLYEVVQKESERLGKEMTPALITSVFMKSFSIGPKPVGRLFLQSIRLFPLGSSMGGRISPASDDSSGSDDLTSLPESEGLLRIEADLIVDGVSRVINGIGHGPVFALCNGLRGHLGLELEVGEVASQVVSREGLSTKIASFVEVFRPSGANGKNHWGVGISANFSTARCRSIVSAANGVLGDLPLYQARHPTRSTSRGDSRAQTVVRLRTGHTIDRAVGAERLLNIVGL